MNEVMTMPNPVVVPVERKCQLAEVFEPGFIALIELVPRNPHVRALILKLTGKMPASECETFEQLRDWVETNCEKKIRLRTAGRSRAYEDDGIAIEVEFKETETGRARYSVSRSGSDTFRVEADDLLQIVRDTIADGGGITEVVDVIAGKIDNNAWEQCQPNMDDYGEYDYSDHDSHDYSDSDTSYSKNDIRNRVLAFLREEHPELAAEL